MCEKILENKPKVGYKIGLLQFKYCMPEIPNLKDIKSQENTILCLNTKHKLKSYAHRFFFSPAFISTSSKKLTCQLNGRDGLKSPLSRILLIGF